MAALQGVTIRTDGTRERFESTTDTLLADLYAAIGTDIVQPLDINNELTIWLDEEGLLKDAPVENTPLEVFAAEHDLTGHRLFGVGVVLGGTDEDGNTLGLTDAQVSEFLGS